MSEPTFWDLMEDILPDDEKGAVTFLCPTCGAEGHFVIVHCACSFNATFCIHCLAKDRVRASGILRDHAQECQEASSDFVSIFGIANQTGRSYQG